MDLIVSLRCASRLLILFCVERRASSLAARLNLASSARRVALAFSVSIAAITSSGVWLAMASCRSFWNRLICSARVSMSFSRVSALFFWAVREEMVFLNASSLCAVSSSICFFSALQLIHCSRRFSSVGKFCFMMAGLEAFRPKRAKARSSKRVKETRLSSESF